MLDLRGVKHCLLPCGGPPSVVIVITFLSLQNLPKNSIDRRSIDPGFISLFVKHI